MDAAKRSRQEGRGRPVSSTAAVMDPERPGGNTGKVEPDSPSSPRTRISNPAWSARIDHESMLDGLGLGGWRVLRGGGGAAAPDCRESVFG